MDSEWMALFVRFKDVVKNVDELKKANHYSDSRISVCEFQVTVNSVSGGQQMKVSIWKNQDGTFGGRASQGFKAANAGSPHQPVVEKRPSALQALAMIIGNLALSQGEGEWIEMEEA